MEDVIIIGGGPAGLQAALTLGRMHRSVVVLDSGRYRNDPADAMHNLIGFDGRTPAELRAAARAELDRYDTVRIVPASVSRVSGELGAFTAETDDGSLAAGRVVIATGVRDTLPAIPEIGSVFGSSVAHCPFCHGHEFAGRRVGLIGPGGYLEHMAALMTPIAGSLTAFPDGPLDDEVAERLGMLGVEIIREPVDGFHRRADGVDIVVDDGSTAHGRAGHGRLERFGGVLVRIDSAPASAFAEELELETSDLGAVYVDPFGRTSVAGVYAAGDIAQQRNMPAPMWAVWSAVATGAAAATGVVQDLAAEDMGRLAACQRPVDPAA